MYVDAAFYTEDYGSIEVNKETLSRILKRASRDIDVLTGFRFDFNKLTERNKRYVKLAVCAQAEFLIANGETASDVSDSGGSFSIGSYSESTSSKGSTQSQKTPRHAASVADYLFPTGLLYAGVGRYGQAYPS